MNLLLMTGLSLLALATTAVAETRYVTDQIVVALRPEQNDTVKPLESLPTGAAVELLEDLGPFLKVRTEGGNTGFVRSRYFVTAPPRSGGGGVAALREQLAGERKKSSELAAEVQRLKEMPAASAGGSAELDAARAELAAVNAKYQQLLSNTDDLPGILREQESLKAEAARLAAENTALRSRVGSNNGNGSSLQWFLAGGAVFLVGWLAGKGSRQKRRFA